MAKNFDIYALVHENEQLGLLCEYPYKKNNVAHVSLLWIKRGDKVKLPALKKRFPVKWVKVRDNKHLLELLT